MKFELNMLPNKRKPEREFNGTCNQQRNLEGNSMKVQDKCKKMKSKLEHPSFD